MARTAGALQYGAGLVYCLCAMLMLLYARRGSSLAACEPGNIWQGCCEGMAFSTVTSLSSLPGTAVRHCDEHKGWLAPNLFNCTSLTFAELKSFVSGVFPVGDRSELQI